MLQFWMASMRLPCASASFSNWFSTSANLRLILSASTVLARVEGAARRLVTSWPSPAGSRGKPGRGVERARPSAEAPGSKEVMRRPWVHLKGSMSCRCSTSSLNTLISPLSHLTQAEVTVWDSCGPPGKQSRTLERSRTVSTPRRTPQLAPGSR